MGGKLGVANRKTMWRALPGRGHHLKDGRADWFDESVLDHPWLHRRRYRLPKLTARSTRALVVVVVSSGAGHYGLDDRWLDQRLLEQRLLDQRLLDQRLLDHRRDRIRDLLVKWRGGGVPGTSQVRYVLGKPPTFLPGRGNPPPAALRALRSLLPGVHELSSLSSS